MKMRYTGCSPPITLTTYRERKILKRFMATPIKASHLLISQIAVNTFLTILGMLVLLVVGKLVFDMQITGKVPAMIIAFLLSMLSVFAIGFIIASVCPNARSGTVVANLVYFPMIFITGATIPIEIMPGYMVQISKFLPLSYVVHLQKGVWLGGSLVDYKGDLLILLAILIAGIVISILTFKWE
jgi:ABC-2 type transport system permease protein